MNETSSKLKIIPLGGLDEIGKNMTAFEYNDEIIVVDAGTSFPEEDMYGVHLIVPDITYLKENREKVKKLIITHGHEDHIGGISYFLRELKVDVYATKLTTAFIREKLRGQKESIKRLKIIDENSVVRTKHFTISFFKTNHSIPDSVGLAIKTPVGTVVHTGDVKIDSTPVDGRVFDFVKVAELAKEGVLALLSDSTNALKPGFSPSEEAVTNAIRGEFRKAKGRIFVATFASNLYRIQTIFKIAEEEKRKVVVVGRSMKSNIKIAFKLGYIQAKKETMISEKEMGMYEPHQLVILVTGSQGEETSALRRLVENKNPHIKLNHTDTVIFSSHTIPGNEKAVGYLLNELAKLDVEVYTSDKVHASGHGYQEELKLLLSFLKPKYFIPIHGEYRMLKEHAKLAYKTGIEKRNVFLLENGDVLEIDKTGARKGDKVKAGAILVDQSGLGDVEFNMMKDRERLANHGVAFIQIDSNEKTRKCRTRVILKGVIVPYERKKILYYEVNKTITEIMNRNKHDKQAGKREIYKEVGDIFAKHLNRRPLIVQIYN